MNDPTESPPASRRRLLTQEQAARLDAEIEREEFQW